jgi:hypothetical protein
MSHLEKITGYNPEGCGVLMLHIQKPIFKATAGYFLSIVANWFM